MTPQTFHLIDAERKANCIVFISELPVGERLAVKIFNEDETRSAAQSRLRWVWMTHLEDKLAGIGKGRDKEQWNCFFKHKYMRTLLIEQDEDYAIFFDNYDDTCEALEKFKSLQNEYKLNYWKEFVKTEWLKVKMFARYLDTIEKYVLEEYQINLPIPQDLEWAREKK